MTVDLSPFNALRGLPQPDTTILQPRLQSISAGPAMARVAAADTSAIGSVAMLDVPGAIARGQEFRAVADERERANALRSFVQENGANLLRGDSEALAALAQFDLDAATGLQSSLLNQQATRQDMEYQDRRLAGEEEERGIRLAEIAAASDRAELERDMNGLAHAYVEFQQTGDPALFDSEAERLGVAGNVTVENFPSFASQFSSALDSIDHWTPDAPPDPTIRDDPNGIPRFVDGAHAGQPVFPGVEPIPEPGEAVGPNGLTTAEQMDEERALRNDWNSLPEVKDFAGVTRAYSNIIASAQQGDGSGDIALITGLQKLLDPNSVVREQEFATAANAGGTLEYLLSLQDRVTNGELLTETTRAQIVGLATEIQREAEQRHAELRGQYEGIATRNGLNPDNALPEYGYTPNYTGAPPFAPVTRIQRRPGEPVQPGPQPAVAPAGQGSPALQPAGPEQASPVALPSVQDVATMDPMDLVTLVTEATDAGVSIPRDLRAAIRARLTDANAQGGQ